MGSGENVRTRTGGFNGAEKQNGECRGTWGLRWPSCLK